MADSVKEFFDSLESRVDADKLAGVDTSYLFDIEGAGRWHVEIHHGHLHVTEAGGDADCTITASSETFERLISGEQNPTSAYMTGKVKIKGDMGAAMKLQKLF